MKPRMKLPESVEKELEGLSDADRFQKVMGRLVQVKPEQVKAQLEVTVPGELAYKKQERQALP